MLKVNNNIDNLYTHFAELFKLYEYDSNWDEEWVFVEESEYSRIFSEEQIADYVEPEIELKFIDEPISFQTPRFDIPLPRINGEYGGCPISQWDDDFNPPTDALGFYTPFHFFYPNWWGIYISKYGIEGLGQIIQNIGDGEVDSTVAKKCARDFIYYHELYHNKIEAFVTKIEIIIRKPLYKSLLFDYKKSVKGTDEDLEEALANVYAYNKVMDELKSNPIKLVVSNALLAFIEKQPPGYRLAVQIIKDKTFTIKQTKLFETYHNLLNGRELDQLVWNCFTQPAYPNLNRNSQLIYLISKDDPISKRVDNQVQYLTYNKLIKKIKKRKEIEYVRNGKGSHEIWETEDGIKVTIPRHQKDMKKGTLNSIIKSMKLDVNLHEFLMN